MFTHSHKLTRERNHGRSVLVVLAWAELKFSHKLKSLDLLAVFVVSTFNVLIALLKFSKKKPVKERE
jgi:hypothetical protein